MGLNCTKPGGCKFPREMCLASCSFTLQAANVTYSPPPHMDAKALIERARQQLLAWHAKYGEHQPQWLPPASDVRWLEDASAYLYAHTLPAPIVGTATLAPVSEPASEPAQGEQR